MVYVSPEVTTRSPKVVAAWSDGEGRAAGSEPEIPAASSVDASRPTITRIEAIGRTAGRVVPPEREGPARGSFTAEERPASRI